MIYFSLLTLGTKLNKPKLVETLLQQNETGICSHDDDDDDILK